MVDIVLKLCGRIKEAERHDQGLKQAEAGDKSSLPLMAFSYAKLVVRGDYVKFRVILGVAESVKGLPDERKGVPVPDGNIVQTAVVLTDPYATPWFGCQHQWRGAPCA